MYMYFNKKSWEPQKSLEKEGRSKCISHTHRNIVSFSDPLIEILKRGRMKKTTWFIQYHTRHPPLLNREFLKRAADIEERCIA